MVGSRVGPTERTGPLAWLLAVCLLLVPWLARAEGGERLVVALSVNHVAKGDAFPMRRGPELLIAERELAAAGVRTELLTGRRENIDGEPYVSLGTGDGTVRFALDEETASLALQVPAALLPVQRIDLRASARPGEVVFHDDLSAFLNYGAFAHGDHLAASTEVGVSGHGALLLSGASWSSGNPAVRGLTTLSHDDREHLVRMALGDRFVNGGALGGSGVIGGLHVYRAFSIDPQHLAQPTLSYSDTVATPSTLEVYVNDRLVRREDLAPGPFELRNLTLPRGQVATRYVLRDALGHEVDIGESRFVAGNQLAPGQSEFDLALGMLRENLALSSFDYTTPAARGSYRRGLTRALTAGARLELMPSLVTGGGSVTLELPVGGLELSVAASHQHQRSGAAAGLTYFWQSRRFGISAHVQRATPAYATLSLTPANDRPLWDAGLAGSEALGKRVTVGLQLSALVWRDLGTQIRASASANLRITTSITGTVTAMRTSGSNELEATSALAVLNFSFGGTTNASTWRSEARTGPNTGVQVVRSLTPGPSFGYRAQAQVGSDPEAEARVEYQGGAGRIAGGVEYVGRQVAPVAELSGGVVWLGSSLAPTRSIDQSYALVRVPGAANVAVMLNNQQLGRTNGHGELVVPNLLAYDANKLSISEADLPADFDSGQTEQRIAPAFRSGALVTFDAVPLSAYRGRVVIDGPAKPVTPAFGELVVGSGKARRDSPLGKGGEFELVQLGVGSLPAEVTFEGGTCRFALDVPGRRGPITDLGVVHCRVQP